MTKNSRILAVDLDGTLIKSDMLLESFWSSFAIDPLIPLKAFFALLKGKAYLKNFLYKSSDLNISSLPYNQVVIDYIKSHRSQGGEVILLTGSNQGFANAISDHLNLFDKVYGSTTTNNLIGLNKASFQKKLFGLKNFDYIGNSYSDLFCWENCEKAITFNASKNLKKSCERKNNNYLHLGSENNSKFLENFIKEIRVYQWIKNILVFLPMIAAQQIGKTVLLESSIAFLAFSLIASSVYILNDLLDLKADRDHPKKCNRPLASGVLSLGSGFGGGISLLVLGLIFGYQLGINFLFILCSYYVITFSYSIYLKRKALLDMFVLSALYTLRIVGGGVATNLDISFWLLAFSLFIFLSLAAIKRQAELINLEKIGKNSMNSRGYKNNDLAFLNSFSLCSGLLSSLVLTLYINSPKALSSYNYPELLWVACSLFLFWIIRICFKTQRGEMEYDPIIFALKDRISIFIFASIIFLNILASN